MLMKKLFYVLVVGVVTAFLCMGCGSDKEGTAKAESTEQQTTEEATAIPEETIAPTPEATEEPREEVTIENEKTEATPEPTEEPTPEPTEEPVPQYTYTDMSATMYAQQTVNIRDLPDADGNKLGSLSTNDEITITGQCNETSWYRFEYNGSVAYVSNKYVDENKVEIQAPANNSGSSGGQASSGQKNWQDYYQDHVWYDMNEFMFIILDSRDEGGTIYGGIDYSGAEATLQARFPDEKVYLRFGCPLRDGHWMYFAYVRPQTCGIDPFVRPFE